MASFQIHLSDEESAALLIELEETVTDPPGDNQKQLLWLRDVLREGNAR